MRFPQISKQTLLSTTAASVALSLTTSPAYVTISSLSTGQKNVTQSLRFGSKSKEVKDLQQMLVDDTVYSSKVDGIYGPVTQASVQKFQADHELEPTGVADITTLKTIYHAYIKKNPAHPTTSQNSASKLLSIGSHGSQVKHVQKILQKDNLYHGHIDGVFGASTEAAVRAFQSYEHLHVDGIVGPSTIKKLNAPHHIVIKNLPGRPKPAASKQKSQTQIIKSVKAKPVPQTFGGTNIIQMAKKFIGSPYHWGGKTPSGFDCSGFIDYIYSHAGIHLPRTVSEIWNQARSLNRPSVGQLVFFQTYKPGPSHVGIYLGRHLFIHASSQGVRISNLNDRYWASHYIGAKAVG